MPTLNAARQAKHARQSLSVRRDQGARVTQRPKILIVDDSAANIQVLHLILQDEYDVSFAGSGRRALALAESAPPDLILLDVMMPDMDGYETCLRLKSDPALKDIPVIFVSALSEDEDESRGFAAGGVDYISKPLRVHTIKARIRTHLELRRHQTDLERLITARTGALSMAYEKLMVMEKTKTNLLNSVSHELRTPLTSLLGFIQMAGKKIEGSLAPFVREKGDENALENLGRIEDNLAVALEEGRRLTRLVDNVIDLLSLVSGAMECAPSPVDVRELAERAIRLVERDYLRKGVGLSVCLPETPVTVMADRERMSQALAHLLLNGAKFAGDRGVTLVAGKKDGRPYITVRDDGPGIAPEHQEMVFERFSQLGDALTGKPEGLGVGLSIAREIVSLHGATLRLESAPGEGCAFTLAFPLAV